MQTIFKYNAIKKRMKDKPSDPYIGDLFAGFKNKLTKAQLTDIKHIINKELDATNKFIDKQMETCTS